MNPMSEPAPVEPDEQGEFHLIVDGEVKTFRIEHDDRGRPFLCEILPLPEELATLFAEQDARPERMVRRSAGG